MRFRGALRACLVAFGLSIATAPAAAQGLCDAPSDSCARLVAPDCIERFGAGATTAPASDACAGPLQTYRECLSTVAAVCGPSGGAASGRSDPAPQRIEGPVVGGARKVEIIEHEPVALTGCVAIESLPTHGVYFISTKTMFCRPDGSIWLRVLSVSPSYGAVVKWTNVFNNASGTCNGAQPFCTMQDDVSGALKMQVLGAEKVKGELMMRVMVSRE